MVSRPRRLPRQRSSAPPEDLDVLEEAEEFDEEEDDDDDDDNDDIPVKSIQQCYAFNFTNSLRPKMSLT